LVLQDESSEVAGGDDGSMHWGVITQEKQDFRKTQNQQKKKKKQWELSWVSLPDA